MKPLSELKEAFGAGRQRPGLNVLRVASAVLHGELVAFGAAIFFINTITGGAAPAGNFLVDLSAAPTAAAAARVLTLTGLPLADETVTIGARVYTFKAALSGANQVLIGADASASIDNLIAAINGAAGAGTIYGTGTVAHADVTASAGAGDTMNATAKAKGTAGNAIASTETLTNGSWAGATLTGGVNPTAGEFTAELVDVANDEATNITATAISANEVLFENWRADTFGIPITCTETLSGSNNAWAANATYGQQGEMTDAFPKITMFSRTPNATELALGNVHILLSFVPASWLVQVLDTDGKIKAIDGKITRTGKRLTVDLSGSVDLVATDKITVFASE